MIDLRIKILITLIVVTVLQLSCSLDNKDTFTKELLDFDIQPDGQSMIFSWGDAANSAIYKMDINSGDPQELFNPKDSLSSYLPRYSPDGTKIVFL